MIRFVKLDERYKRDTKDTKAITKLSEDTNNTNSRMQKEIVQSETYKETGKEWFL